jgi:hypothetical protein
LNNKSIDFARTWKENGLSYSETIRQEYGGNNCVISAGFVEGHDKPEVDIIYVRLEKDGVEPTTLLLRPDEAQALAWVSSGVVWSHLMQQVETRGGVNLSPTSTAS